MAMNLMLLFCLIAPTFAFGFGPFHPPFGGGHFAPNFLRNVSNSARRQFFQVASNPNDTKSQIQSNLMNWAQSNGVQAAYLNFSQMVEQKAQQMNANMSQWLAGDALELYNELWTVRQNMQITRLAECQQIRQLLNGTLPGLRCIVPIPPSVILGPAPHECFRGPFKGGFGKSFESHVGGHFHSFEGNGTMMSPAQGPDDEEDRDNTEEKK